MDHSSLTVTPVEGEREREFQQLMQEHHYLGALRKIGNTIRYVAVVDGHWLGLLSFSAAALKCVARDEWIGWSRAHRPIEAGGEQFAFSDSARPSLSEPRFADSVALPATVAARLAGTVLATVAGAGNMRGSGAAPRHHLSGCGLDAGRRHQGLSP